jgi:hypothetical protein
MTSLSREINIGSSTSVPAMYDCEVEPQFPGCFDAWQYFGKNTPWSMDNSMARTLEKSL